LDSKSTPLDKNSKDVRIQKMRFPFHFLPREYHTSGVTSAGGMQPSGGGAPGGGEEEAAALAGGGAASGGAEARASRGGMQPPCGGVPGGGGEEAAAPASGGAASGGAEARAEEEAAAPGRACFVPPASGGKIAHWTWHAEGEASAAHVPGATSLPAAWVRQGAGMPPALMVDCVRALSVACGGVGVGYDQRVVDRLQGRNKQDVALKRHTYLLAAVRWRPNDIAPGADGYELVRVVTVDKLAAMMTLASDDKSLPLQYAASIKLLSRHGCTTPATNCSPSHATPLGCVTHL
jgi:hypothetical protein